MSGRHLSGHVRSQWCTCDSHHRDLGYRPVTILRLVWFSSGPRVVDSPPITPR